MTLFTFAPAAPRLTVARPAPQAGGPLLVQLQGQPGTTYVIQTSTNLSAWTAVSTLALGTNSTVVLTNLVPAGPGPTFWRAEWQGL